MRQLARRVVDQASGCPARPRAIASGHARELPALRPWASRRPPARRYTGPVGGRHDVEVRHRVTPADAGTGAGCDHARTRRHATSTEVLACDHRRTPSRRSRRRRPVRPRSLGRSPSGRRDRLAGSGKGGDPPAASSTTVVVRQLPGHRDRRRRDGRPTSGMLPGPQDLDRAEVRLRPGAAGGRTAGRRTAKRSSGSTTSRPPWPSPQASTTTCRSQTVTTSGLSSETRDPRQPGRRLRRTIADTKAAAPSTSATARAVRRRVIGHPLGGVFGTGRVGRPARQRGPTRNLRTTGLDALPAASVATRRTRCFPDVQPLLRSLAVERLRAAARLQRPALGADLAPLPVPPAPLHDPDETTGLGAGHLQPRSVAGRQQVRSQPGPRQHRGACGHRPALQRDSSDGHGAGEVVVLPLPSVAVTRTS